MLCEALQLYQINKRTLTEHSEDQGRNFLYWNATEQEAKLILDTMDPEAPSVKEPQPVEVKESSSAPVIQDPEPTPSPANAGQSAEQEPPTSPHSRSASSEDIKGNVHIIFLS